jgi:hypothetical protein
MILQNYNRSTNVAMEHNGSRLGGVADFETQNIHLKIFLI